MPDQYVQRLVTHSLLMRDATPVLTSVDVLQIHWPVTEPQKKGDRIDPSVKETWTAMEKLVDEVRTL